MPVRTTRRYWWCDVDPKPIVAIISCWDHRDREQAQQRTWATHHSLWFTGPMLNVPDDYSHLPFKVQAACRWLLRAGYTHCWKADTDTYCSLDRLFSSGYEKHDYIGYELEGKLGRYASGGAGYWLSRRAMEVLSKAPCAKGNEDEWVGFTLAQAGVTLHNDSRYALYRDCLPGNDVISRHLSSREGFKLDMMQQAHELYSSSSGKFSPSSVVKRQT